MTTLNYTGQLIVQDCCNCGMTFAVPADYDKRRRNDHKSFYCPAGHPQSYTGKTEEQKQRERAERLERQLANRDEDLRSARASLTATKGVLTKTKKRVANGVCPCCNRSFANLGRHMAGQHPEFAEATA
jgi:hypothetical protein